MDESGMAVIKKKIFRSAFVFNILNYQNNDFDHGH